MTAHASRQRLGLAHLIAEARHRMRRRRSVAALLLALVGLAVGLSFGLRSPSTGPGASRPVASSVRVRGLRVSAPQGLVRYPVRLAGTRPPVIGRVLTNFAIPAGVEIDGSVGGMWSASPASGPPANRVALELRWMGIAPPVFDPPLLRLPLTLSEAGWLRERFHGGAVGLYGYLRFHNMDYIVLYLSGRSAPATDRAAILQALESIRPAHR